MIEHRVGLGQEQIGAISASKFREGEQAATNRKQVLPKKC